MSRNIAVSLFTAVSSADVEVANCAARWDDLWSLRHLRLVRSSGTEPFDLGLRENILKGEECRLLGCYAVWLL
jgi:hypothetical protein